MPAKIFAPAEERLIEIWDYTSEKWGEELADRYIRRLVEFLHAVNEQRSAWRPSKVVQNVWCSRREHHFIFFRELSNGQIGVITILHENMDLPARLKGDWERVGDS